MITFFKFVVYQPLYNALVFLLHIIPGGDVGVTVILLTIFVKLALFPVSLKNVQTQAKMREIQKPMDEIKAKYKDNREEQARQIMLLYQKYKLNPLSGFINLFIQIPVIISLYYVFLKGLPVINTSLLYAFVTAPSTLNMHFLGLIDISTVHNVWLALVVALSQYFQATFAIPNTAPADKNKPTFQEDMMRSMRLQARFVFPILIFFVAYKLIGAVSLYWIVSNLFAIGQELYIRKKYHVLNKAPLPGENLVEEFKEVKDVI